MNTNDKMQPTSSASSAADFDSIAIALSNAKSWHHGDKWRESEDSIQQTAWAIQMQNITNAIESLSAIRSAAIVPQVAQAPIDHQTMPYATFQDRVQPWMMECFGAEISADRMERNHRFFEEAAELIQANGMTRSEAHQLVDYTFDRPIGELTQESGGVSVTHAALCLASGINMHEAAEIELARIWTKVPAIRAKQAAKPAHSPLPVAAPKVATVPSDSRIVPLRITPDMEEAACNAGDRNFGIEYLQSIWSAMLNAAPSTAEQASDVRNAVLDEVAAMISTSGLDHRSMFASRVRGMKSATPSDKSNAPAEASGELTAGLLDALQFLLERAESFNANGVYFDKFRENKDALDTARNWVAKAKSAPQQSAEEKRLVQHVCKLGRKGAAYDASDTKYAYTYDAQPDSVGASRLGHACSVAAKEVACGDSIDRGLILLRELQSTGFGVFEIAKDQA